MTTIEHLDAAQRVRSRTAGAEGKLYTALIQERQANAVLRSLIEKLQGELAQASECIEKLSNL